MLDPEREARFGPIHRVQKCQGEHDFSQAFRVELKTGKTIFVKRLSDRGYKQEMAFYRAFSARLENIPELLDNDDEKRTLILSEVAGSPVVGKSNQSEVYRQAGKFLAELHSLDFTDFDELPLKTALLKRLKAFNREAGLLVEESYLCRLNVKIASLMNNLHLQRVPCHRDFMEYNWLVTDEGKLSVLDFEHARPDYWLLDLCKMNALAWLIKPHLKDSFLNGYEYCLEPWEESLLRLWTVVWSAGTMQWARTHDDQRYFELAAKAMALLGVPLRE